jgi:hypothetical protein
MSCGDDLLDARANIARNGIGHQLGGRRPTRPARAGRHRNMIHPGDAGAGLEGAVLSALLAGPSTSGFT